MKRWYNCRAPRNPNGWRAVEVGGGAAGGVVCVAGALDTGYLEQRVGSLVLAPLPVADNEDNMLPAAVEEVGLMAQAAGQAAGQGGWARFGPLTLAALAPDRLSFAGGGAGFAEPAPPPEAAAAASGVAGRTFSEDLSATEVAELGTLLAGLGPGISAARLPVYGEDLGGEAESLAVYGEGAGGGVEDVAVGDGLAGFTLSEDLSAEDRAQIAGMLGGIPLAAAGQAPAAGPAVVVLQPPPPPDGTDLDPSTGG